MIVSKGVTETITADGIGVEVKDNYFIWDKKENSNGKDQLGTGYQRRGALYWPGDMKRSFWKWQCWK